MREFPGHSSLPVHCAPLVPQVNLYPTRKTWPAVGLPRGMTKLTVHTLSPATSSPFEPSSYIWIWLGVLAPRTAFTAGSCSGESLWTQPTKNMDLPGLSVAHLKRSALAQLPFLALVLKSTVKTTRRLFGSGQPDGRYSCATSASFWSK